jgi:hypothetical protein
MDQLTARFIRTFYQGLALPEQLLFYKEVITGNHETRKAWIKNHGAAYGITPEQAAMLLTLGTLSKEEVAMIVAVKAAEEVQPKVQNIFVRFWNWLFGRNG